jgi:molybdopterin/thiamine biosynthesis adenylyltransferase
LSKSATAWFERWPELLEWELERFRAWGIGIEIDANAKKGGQLRVLCETTLDTDRVPIEAHYPSEYPELPPVIFGPPGLIDRHQHRFGGNFCLLARPLDDWPAGSWGAADLIGQRLSALMRDTEAGPDAVREAEEPMPEPVSAYFRQAADATVLFAEDVRPTGERGTLRARRPAPHLFVIVANEHQQLGEELASLFPGDKELAIPWLRLSEAPPFGPDGTDVANWLRREHPGLLAQDLPPRLRQSKRLRKPPAEEICGIVFPEEGPGVGERRDAWLFIYVDRRTGERREALIGAQPLSPAEHGRRRPELEGLAQSRVTVIGLGTLGGDVTVELAKAGVGELELVDFDSLQVGNLMRHRLGIEYVGLPKTRALQLAARRANPFCQIATRELQLGAVEWEGESPLLKLAGAIEGADLVIEASGSHQLAQLTSRLCAESGRPMIAAWLSEGFFGAEVVRIKPGETMCWRCFAAAQRRGELAGAEDGPPSQVIAEGCSHPTSAGAGFDALEAAALTARMAAQTLRPTGGYPDSEWNHAVLNFRRHPEDPDHPRMRVHALPPVSDCESCAARVGSSARP